MINYSSFRMMEKEFSDRLAALDAELSALRAEQKKLLAIQQAAQAYIDSIGHLNAAGATLTAALAAHAKPSPQPPTTDDAPYWAIRAAWKICDRHNEQLRNAVFSMKDAKVDATIIVAEAKEGR